MFCNINFTKHYSFDFMLLSSFAFLLKQLDAELFMVNFEYKGDVSAQTYCMRQRLPVVGNIYMHLHTYTYAYAIAIYSVRQCIRHASTMKHFRLIVLILYCFLYYLLILHANVFQSIILKLEFFNTNFVVINIIKIL